MHRVLVTGATGFVGRQLVRRMVGDFELYCLSRRPAPDLELEGITWQEHDLSQSNLPAEMPSGIDSVIHLAQSRHYRDFPEKADDIYNINVHSTALLAEWARSVGVTRFISVSSGGIYRPSEAPLTEDSPIHFEGPLSYYMATKHAAELLLEPYASFFAVIILRPFFIYGPNQPHDMFIPRIIGKVRRGDAVILQSSDGIRVNPVHVNDMVNAILKTLTLDHIGPINVAGPDVLTLKSLANIIAGHCGLKAVFKEQVDAKPAHRVAEISLMAEILGHPGVRFETGVATLCGE